MSDRYSKLFALSENLYSVGAPVVIAAGALQKDNQTGKVFAQLKIRNIQDKVIKAATVKIATFDTVGKPLGGTVDYQYLDLSAERDTDFGQKTPVMLKEAATRSFAVSVSEVIFSDNSIWTASNETWEPLSAPIAPEKEFADGELAKQYRAKYGADCKCIFKKEKDLWRCACGAINHDSEKNCHSCQREAAALVALNVDELKADRDKRLAAEQKKVAEEKAAAAEQAKKTKKIAMIAAPIVVVAIVAAVLISNFVKAQQEEAARLDTYNAAVSLAEKGKYDEAIAAFTELGDYKDSVSLIESTKQAEKYSQAFALLESNQDNEAYKLFKELGDYKDAATYCERFICVLLSVDDGHTTEYTYDDYGRLLEENGDWLKKYFYNEDGLCIRREEYISDRLQNTHLFTYKNGLCITEELQCETVSGIHTFSYDNAGNLIEDRFPHVFTYQGVREYEDVTTYSYDGAGNCTTEQYLSQRTDIDPGEKGHTRNEDSTTYFYDDEGNLSGKQKNLRYIQQTVSGPFISDSVMLEEYDSKGNVTRRITQSLDEAGNVKSESEIVFQNSYDKDGNLLSITNNNNDHTTEYTYGYIYIPK